jgi:transcription termination/antitermination protein NusA
MSTHLEDIKQHIELLCIERNLEADEVMSAIEIAIAAAYRKEFGEKDSTYIAKFNESNGKYSVFRTWTVVNLLNQTDEEGNAIEELKNPEKEIDIVKARLSNPEISEGDIIKEELVIEDEVNFGRIASQIAKQVLFQTINSTRHTKILQQFKDKIGDIVSVEIDFFRKGGYLVKIGQTVGFLNRENLLPIDKFKPGQVVKALIVDINEDERGNSRVVLSRTNPDFIKAIIAKEVPEVASGIVIINKLVRESGSRSKLLVTALEGESIDPVGTILGRKNVRLINIMREISTSLQEKIDVIELRSDDLEGMIMDALEPAEIDRVELNQEKDHADVYCYPEEASLAVGKRGVNIRLATELLGVELNIVTLEEEDVTEANFENPINDDYDEDEGVLKIDDQTVSFSDENYENTDSLESHPE